ncbi:MAG: hypothetical protein GQ582_07370 [Methyloprofundus sp.]|nr:hypothetical protein [Methyloprofundus sp.]
MTENNLYNGNISLKLFGFSDENRLKFESIFAIAEGRLEASWRIVESTADFYLLFHGLREELADNPELQVLSAEQCVFYVLEGDVNSAEHEDFGHVLLVGHEFLPSLRSLLALFNELSALMEQKQSAVDDISTVDVKSQVQAFEEKQENTSPVELKSQIVDSVDEPSQSTQDTNSIDYDYYDLECGFIGGILSEKTGIYQFELEVKGKSSKQILYINFAETVYYSQSQLEQLTNFCSSDKVLSNLMTVVELEQAIHLKGLQALPLNHLIWYGVFHCSAGRPRKGYKESDIVRLKRWPDINIPGCRTFIKLAAYMQSNAVELSVAQDKTGFSMQQVYSFYNACYATGLIEQAEQVDAFDKQLSGERQNLFAKISDRLAQSKSN